MGLKHPRRIFKLLDVAQVSQRAIVVLYHIDDTEGALVLQQAIGDPQLPALAARSANPSHSKSAYVPTSLQILKRTTTDGQMDLF